MHSLAPADRRSAYAKPLALLVGACTIVALLRLSESIGYGGPWTADKLVAQLRWRLWDWWFWVPGALVGRQLILRLPALRRIDTRALALHVAVVAACIVIHRAWSLFGYLAFDPAATWEVFTSGHFFAVGSMAMVDGFIWAIVALATVLSDAPVPPITQAPKFMTSIVARVGRHQRIIDVASIRWIEADGYCARIHDTNRSTVVRMSLASLESTLDPDRFMRVHRSAIVARDAIGDIRSNGAGVYDLVLTDGKVVPVSRAKYSAIRGWLAVRSKG